ncbi:hypothetical protein HYS96_01710 [Candidatus Daviesbacteria bacterium]|nr:hypothetical protein [Candidatus Daviesbacteria bacterium]
MFSKAQVCVAEPNMALHQSKHQSDLEKRLKILRQQFYGRNDQSNIYSLPASPVFDEVRQGRQRGEPSTTKVEVTIDDTTYLRQDLLKISIFAGTALGLQIILYFLMKNNVLNINIF